MPTPPQKIAFYLRVSTLKQDTRAQLHALVEFCRRQGWAPPPAALRFSEKASGSKASRTQLDLLQQACRAGHVDTIVTYAVDRMGRNALNTHNLIAELDRLKVRLIGVSDGIDTRENNSVTAMYRGMLITFAESERMRISERTHSGLKSAKARGRSGGKPRKNDAAIAQAFKLKAEMEKHLNQAAQRNGLPRGGSWEWAIKKEKKLSLAHIAKKTGLSRPYLCLLFQGKSPSAKKVKP